MTAEIPNNNQWLEDSQIHFANAYELAMEIGDQNQLYSELVESGQVTLLPFQQAATEYLTQEQLSTFHALGEAQTAAPYEELAAKEQQIRLAMGDIAAQLSMIEQQQTEEAALIHSEQELIVSRIPKLAAKLSAIAASLEQSLIVQAKVDLESQKAVLETEYESLTDVFAVAGRAWPIPALAVLENKSSEVAIDDHEVHERQDDLIEIDDFPGANKIRLTNEQIADKVRRKYPEEILKDASEFIALFLAERPKYIYTLEELAQVLYGPDVPHGNSRVSALVSSFERGKVAIIGRVLEEKRLAFQRGERRSYHPVTAEQFGRSHPVFRAIPLEEIDNKERVVHSGAEVEWVIDGWHTVTFDSNAVESQSSIVEDEGAREPEAAAVIIYPEIELARSIPAFSDELSPNGQLGEVSEKKEPEWKAEFRTCVQDVISIFAAEGLMNEGDISWKTVKLKSSSRSMATETMANQAIASRIITKNESGLDSVLPVSRFICMALQNRNKETFSNRSRRKLATEIVEEMVAGHFKQAEQDNY